MVVVERRRPGPRHPRGGPPRRGGRRNARSRGRIRVRGGPGGQRPRARPRLRLAMDPGPVFAALADPTRRAILERVAASGDATPTALAAGLPVTRQAVAKHLGAPLVGVDRKHAPELLPLEVEALGLQRALGGHEADRGLGRLGATRAALDDPGQHPRVLAETGPQELAVVVLAEPVDVEDAR